MVSKILETPIDDFVKLIKVLDGFEVEEIKMRAKREFGVYEDTIEKWLIILEEAKIISVKYRGLKSYIEYRENKKEKKEKILDMEKMKSQFKIKAREKNIQEGRVEGLWAKFLEQSIENIKQEFIKKSLKQERTQEEIIKAWEKYKGELVKL